MNPSARLVSDCVCSVRRQRSVMSGSAHHMGDQGGIGVNLEGYQCMWIDIRLSFIHRTFKCEGMRYMMIVHITQHSGLSIGCSI